MPAPPDVWCLLAPIASRAELLAAGDCLISGRSRYTAPHASLSEIVAAVDRFRHTRGHPLRSEVLRLLRTGVESPAESELRLVIIDAGFPEPEVQCPVVTAGRTLQADLGYPKLRIAIEYEGAAHFGPGSLERGRRDVARARAMEASGWRVIRVTVYDLRNPREFLTILAAAIREASARG